MTRLILASASRTRAKLLENAGLVFEAIAPNVDEITVKESLLGEGAEPGEVADGLAELKARKVSSAYPDDIVIGADQVLVFCGEIISKSPDIQSARSLLARLAGHAHELVASVVLAKDGGVIWRHIGRTELTMRKFTDSFLDAYLSAVGDEALTSVGCYQLEGRGVQLFSRISGDYFTILGLPLLPLLGALRDLGAIET